MNKNILEMFCSIQGEGKYIGIPSIFIRFAKCNLKCAYCDTAYSLNESGKYNVVDAVDYINENKDYGHIVITGGEPLLYQDDIVKIIGNFPGKMITIESNGTIKPTYELVKKMYNDIWSISPKLYRLNEETIGEIIGWDAFDNCQFKFVIGKIDDFKEIELLIRKKIITRPIIVQPNGMEEECYDELCQRLADYVITNRLTNFRVLPQFQKICWGQRRGK